MSGNFSTSRADVDVCSVSRTAQLGAPSVSAVLRFHTAELSGDRGPGAQAWPSASTHGLLTAFSSPDRAALTPRFLGMLTYGNAVKVYVDFELCTECCKNGLRVIKEPCRLL